jgi:hypothetical protein
MVDDDTINWAFRGFQFQAELIFEGRPLAEECARDENCTEKSHGFNKMTGAAIISCRILLLRIRNTASFRPKLVALQIPP